MNFTGSSRLQVFFRGGGFTDAQLLLSKVDLMANLPTTRSCFCFCYILCYADPIHLWYTYSFTSLSLLG